MKALHIVMLLSITLIAYSTFSITTTLAQNATRTDEYVTSMNDIYGEIIVLFIAIGNFVYTKFIAGKENEDNYAWFKSGLAFLQLAKDKQETVHQSNAMMFKLFETIDPKIYDKINELFPLAKLQATKEKTIAISEKIIALTQILNSSEGKLSSSEVSKIKNELVALTLEEKRINEENGAPINVT